MGNENRQKSGRELHEVVSHPERNEPLVVAFEVGQPPAELLGFVPLETPSTQPSEASVDSSVSPKVRISVQREAIDQVFKAREIRAHLLQIKDGRLEDKKNVVQVYFTPRAFSFRAIKYEFLIICAIIYGSQLQENTIDVISGIAEGPDGKAQMTLDADITHYRAYLDGTIDLEEWENRLQLNRF